MSSDRLKSESNENGENSHLLVSRDNEDKSTADKGSNLITAFLLMILFQLGNRIFGRLQTYPMHNYPLFMNILSVSIYIPICFAYIIPMIRFGGSITKSQREIPKYKFAIMGMWDSVAGIMQTFAVNYISNASTIVLVQQSAIPISMVISKIALQASYSFSQYLGASIVLVGIIIVLIPTLFQAHSTDPTVENSSENFYQLLWIFVLVVSCVPMCLSSVYKEKALDETEIDVVYLNGWVAIFQFAFALPLCFPSAYVINVAFYDILPNMLNGFKCWMGVNSSIHDDCSTAPLFVTTYLCFNVVYNILIVVILKYGSANVLWMASTVIVPLSNIAFSLDFMPGHKPIRDLDMVGLVVIMLGLLFYRFTPQLLSLWKRLTGTAEAEGEMTEEERNAVLIGKQAERKQAKYVGLNQIEGIQSLFDTRIWKEQRKMLYRSPAQIRGNLHFKLGIPPSPHIGMSPMRKATGGSSRNYIPSPSIQLARTKQNNSNGNSYNSIKALPDRIYRDGTSGKAKKDFPPRAVDV